jgi:hypothetical protein
MTDKLCDALNLPRLEDALKDIGMSPTAIQEAAQEVENMANALERIAPSDMMLDDESGISEHEREMNEIYTQALKTHKELIDLAFNIEAKHAGTIFEPAARFLETALTASKSKNEQKLKAIKLRMDREKLDADLKKNVQEGEIQDEPDIHSVLANRNDLLKDLKERLKAK